MDAAQARWATESLRKGIPPDGHIRHFTVGRASEIKHLTDRLERGECGSLLIKANYGSGKSHLLRFIREVALEKGYAVSSVTLDCKSAVRFNRMDQVVGAVWRGLEIPGDPERGVRSLFPLLCEKIEESKAHSDDDAFWNRLTDRWTWDFSEVLEAPAMFVALRAWATGKLEVQDLVEGWLFEPWIYATRRKFMYEELVLKLRRYFRDPRPDYQFYSPYTGIFNFRSQEYVQSWATLRDMQKLSRAAGLRGMVILFDEFEDVITNLKNISYQEAAFWNLFQFYAGTKFAGMTFFAVTPEFAAKCKRLLYEKAKWDFDYSRFEALPSFEMSPLGSNHLEELALRILEAHGIAYGWEPDTVMRAAELRAIVRKAASAPIQDRARQAIREVVKSLDDLLQTIE